MGETVQLVLAIVTGLVALTTAVAALISALVSYRTKRDVEIARKEAEKTSVKVDEVHTLVNAWRTEMEARVQQLTRALVKSDVEVPEAPKRTPVPVTDPALAHAVADVVAAATSMPRPKEH